MKYPKLNSGFSLLEVMCAILILGVALAGLTQGMTTALRSSKESEVQATAANLAAGQTEIARADKYIMDGETEGECGSELPSYRWRQTVSPAQPEGLHEVKVVILEAKTEKTIYELKTLIFDPDYAGQDTQSKKTDAGKKKEKGRSRQ